MTNKQPEGNLNGHKIHVTGVLVENAIVHLTTLGVPRSWVARSLYSVIALVHYSSTSTQTHSCEAWQEASDKSWTNPRNNKCIKIIEAYQVFGKREPFSLRKTITPMFSFPSPSLYCHTHKTYEWVNANGNLRSHIQNPNPLVAFHWRPN